MRILITGGAGLVGSHAAEYYAKKGKEVIVLDNLMRSQLFGYDKKSVEYNWRWLQ
ncbi:MAG TPA: NAD-dependent epimerase/dehydratase family protein, partial [Marinobacter sp.]|nr:NAD-dependent epimerase/dehydratase family protein [Marinobacter sp.]